MTADGWEAVFAVIGAATCLYWIVRLLSAFLRRIQPPAEAGDAPAPTGPGAHAVPSPNGAAIPAHHIVAIAAAIGAGAMGESRIVHIQDARSGASWTSGGRWMHQTSHNLH